MNDDQRSAVAELIGTFTLVFIGAGAGVVSGMTGGGGLTAVALAHGIALMVIVYAWGSISGAHVNPAVTLGIALTGRMTWTKAAWYWGAQLIGATIAAFLLAFLLQSNLGAMETKGSYTDTDAVRTIVTEAVLTFFLLIAVFASGVGGRSGNAAGVAIGFVLTMDILAGGPLTGASMNPARTFGPALVNGNLKYLWMYIVGPCIGGGLGAVVYDRVFLPARDKPPVEAAEDTHQRRVS